MVDAIISSEQIRMARSALRYSVVELSKMSGVSTSTIKRIEAADGNPKSNKSTLLLLMRTFEAAGIEFIGTPDDRPGIRIGKPSL